MKFPVLRIHCWGGLGSQLLALSYYGMIQNTHPSRDIQIVLHTGGVTERKSEIDFLSDRVNLILVHDFEHMAKEKNTNKTLTFRIRTRFKNLVKTILNYVRLIITNESDIQKIKPWTTNVRCSYVNIELSTKVIRDLGNLLQYNSKILNTNFIGIHLRVGDLVALKPQSLVNISTISKLINNLNLMKGNPNKIIVYSDSELNLDSFNLLTDFAIELRNIDTLNTIFDLTSPRVFIGTNSKVSLWIAIFRYGFEIPGIVLLPTSIFDAFNKLISPFQRIENFEVSPYTP